MSTSEQQQETVRGSRARRGTSRLTVAAVIAVLVVVSVFALLVRAAGGEAAGQEDIPTAKVQRGQFVVKVTEGGTLRAMESLEIKSEVEGNNQILEVVPEGTVITPQDVADGKVLVQLDVSDQEEQKTSREISYRNAESSYVQASENFAIQEKQNESNIAASELKNKFSVMELERYLGAALAQKLLAGESDFFQLGALALQQVEEILGPELSADVLAGMPPQPPAQDGTELGGVAKQTLRELSADVQLAEQELQQAAEQLTYSKQLFERQYISRNELTGDELDTQRRDVQLESAKEELRLFIRYTLAKEAEQRFSDYEEAVRELDRVKARAESELAQAKANLDSREATYRLEKDRLEKGNQMIQKATIVATKPGVVVYASTSDPWRRRSNPIQEGSSVRENETILTVPDLKTMAARVSVHETEIGKVKAGQAAWVQVEALPGQRFPAKVANISPMASSEHRFLNPDVMVYETDVALTEIPENATPGMSATAEIIIADIDDALTVPVQAVTTHGRDRVCWVKTAGGHELRRVQCGHFSPTRVQILDGLDEGEEVFLAPPEELPAVATEETEVPPGGEEAAPSEPGPQPARVGPQPGPSQEPSGPQPAAQTDQAAVESAGAVDVEALIKKLESAQGDDRRELFRSLTDQERQALRNLTDEQRQRLFGMMGEGGGRWPRGGEGGEGGGRGNWPRRGEGGGEGGGRGNWPRRDEGGGPPPGGGGPGPGGPGGQ
jgi:HlyD family secretion protein